MVRVYDNEVDSVACRSAAGVNVVKELLQALLQGFERGSLVREGSPAVQHHLGMGEKRGGGGGA